MQPCLLRQPVPKAAATNNPSVCGRWTEMLANILRNCIIS
jgi:hypothetical protein